MNNKNILQIICIFVVRSIVPCVTRLGTLSLILIAHVQPKLSPTLTTVYNAHISKQSGKKPVKM